jgi:hypothetical protein
MHGPACIFWANLTPFSLPVLDAAGFDCTPVGLAADLIAPEDTDTYTTPRPFKTLPNRYFLRAVRRSSVAAAASDGGDGVGGGGGGGVVVALDITVIQTPLSILHWRFSIQNILSSA